MAEPDTQTGGLLARWRRLGPGQRRAVIVIGGVLVGVLVVMLTRSRGGGGGGGGGGGQDPAAPVDVGPPPAAGSSGYYIPNSDAGSGAGEPSGVAWSDALEAVAGKVQTVSEDLTDALATQRQDTAQMIADAREAERNERSAYDQALAGLVQTFWNTYVADKANPAVVPAPAPAPAVVATAPAPAPAPAAPTPTGPVGGRRVGPWDTAAKRDAAVANIPPDRVRKYSEPNGKGGRNYYAEIFG